MEPGARKSNSAAKQDAGAHAADGDEHAGEGAEHEESSVIEISPAIMKEAGILVEPVLKQPMTATVSAPGQVVPAQNSIAHVGTIVPGRVTRFFVSEGSAVARGTALAEIEAFDIGELKGDYLTARASVDLQRAAVARQERLAGEAIGAKRVLEEARTALAHAVAAQRAAEAKLQSLGISLAGISAAGFSSRITLRSPIAGVVSHREANLGEFIEVSKDVFEVVNTSVVWIDAQLPPTAASQIRIGSAGFIHDAKGERSTGRVIFIAPTVDPESRTVTVRIGAVNSNNRLRPNTFVTTEFERGVTGAALVVATSALEQVGADYFVYRQIEPGHFERIAIQVGERTSERTVVTAGLREGDRVATAGVFYLKSARQKDDLAEHDH